jgi:hypothetical protein
VVLKKLKDLLQNPKVLQVEMWYDHDADMSYNRFCICIVRRDTPIDEPYHGRTLEYAVKAALKDLEEDE